MIVLKVSLTVVSVTAAASFSNVPAVAKDIFGTAVSAGNFTTLAAAVKVSGLVETLGSKVPLTVFAPTNEAFAKLPAGTVETLLNPENKEKLVGILTHQVIPGAFKSTDIAGKKIAVKTVQGADIKVDAMSGVMITDVNVTTVDIAASNGVIHVIAKVILPRTE